jgi:HK97 gp10 family phage protein
MASWQDIQGLVELIATFNRLPDVVAQNALRPAVSAGATVIENEVISRAPVLTGKLKANVYQKYIPEESNSINATYFVGVRNDEAFYWRFQEFGTSKMSATPFVRPAFEAKKQEAIQEIKDKFAEKILDITNKL